MKPLYRFMLIAALAAPATVTLAQGAKTEVLHKTAAVVKSADRDSGKVTLAHGPIKSLQWPSMTMAFLVKDKSLFDKLVVGKQVDVALVQDGSNYVVTAVK
ncbi:copper-binding protein [Massilia sp. H6]|uniref:copper-binding protein n=1 Tax=Massilia sp. H6 TaxID=2970464 RepID=UPI0021691841|nr:copper-binding protein [Massilia sp. H6]UVW30051.1 copper-binding protein [Massilia sp. H6]